MEAQGLEEKASAELQESEVHLQNVLEREVAGHPATVNHACDSTKLNDVFNLLKNIVAAGAHLPADQGQ
eukprot:1505376-Lingulodinium_polyedra.AAC.1